MCSYSILHTCLNAKMGLVWNAAQLSSCFTQIRSYQLPADLNARLFQIAKVYRGRVWGGGIKGLGRCSQGFEEQRGELDQAVSVGRLLESCEVL